MKYYVWSVGLALIGIMIFVAWVFARNATVFKLRMWVLDDLDRGLPDRLKCHRLLPDYRAMVFHPKYAHMWTRKQWMRWLFRNELHEVLDKDGVVITETRFHETHRFK